MWLKLDLDGIVVRFQIKGYLKTNKTNWDTEWCKTDFSFTSEPWLNYYKSSDELLLAEEVDCLKEAFGRLLEDRLDEKMCIECVEPDFVFNLCPKEDIRNNPKVLYVQPGREIVDISVDWEIHFWEDGGMTANYLSVTLDRNDIEYLYRYLQLVTGEIKQDDPQIINMIQRDVLYQ